jgi:hypothetical protein
MNAKKYFRGRKMNLREVIMIYGRLAFFIGHDFAEVWGLGMDSHLALALKKIWPEPAFSCV